MGTKPPPDVKKYPEDSIEAKAYRSVEDIPTHEPNDRSRLGFHVWRWLTMDNKTSLGEQITVSGARLLINKAEAEERILKKLKELDAPLPE